MNTAQEQENKAIAREVFDALSRGDMDRMKELSSPDLVVHSGSTEYRGSDSWQRAFTAFRQAFPDLVFTIEDMMAEGDKVEVRWSMHATHKGEFADLDATSREVTQNGVSIYRIADGRVVEAWVISDVLLFEGESESADDEL